MRQDETKERPAIPFSYHLMFRRVMRDPAMAKGLLERILGIEIERIEYCNTEQTLDFNLEAKGVRLDLYVRDDTRAFNVEMQTQDYADLGLRMAYYQSAINSNAVERGTRGYRLPETFIIFLCVDDPFGYGCPRYTFRVACEEAEGLALDTGSHWLVLNAADHEREQDEGVRNLLEYIRTQRAPSDDVLLGRIDEKVRLLNRDEELVRMASMFMTYEEDAIARGELRGLRIGREEGIAEGEAQGRIEGKVQGRIEGENRLSALIDRLLEDDRIADIKRVTADAAYREKLFGEFGIA